MSAINQIPSWLSDELKGASLVDRMLEIQGHEILDKRTMDWFERLECLSVHPKEKKVLTLAERDPENGSPRDFVAVSYSFKSAYESLEKSTMGFEVWDPNDKFLKRVKTRDIVIERVIKYAEAVGTEFFWIDQECFDEDVPDERQKAMDSMDLVYQRSEYSVALLEIILEPSEIELLDILMSGRYEEDVHRAKIDSMVHMLRHIQGDKWWTRAWTFQEEYLASDHMKLLIRHTSPQGVRIRSTLADIEGEVCVRAIQFRDRATKFLSDLMEKNTTTEEFRVTCKNLLRPFRRYNLLEETTDSANGVAMSPFVFEDLECRGIDEPFDFLPIAANVCGYGVRLTSTELAKTSHSDGLVGLCALTMYLLNGEIFFNGELIRTLPTGKGLSEYIKYISPGLFVPPLGDRRLTWMKDCRLWPATLSLEGIVTSGLLWHVHTKIETFNWDDGQREKIHPGEFRLNAYKRKRLTQLLKKLRLLANCARLSFQLGRYLNEDVRLPKSVEYYMDLMAEEVVEAIRCGNSLYLATLRGPHKASAIFVEGTGDETTDSGTVFDSGEDATQLLRTAVDFSAFTSWSPFHHVSVTVKLTETAGESGSPLMTITGWTNGLTFYEGVRQREDLVVRWPEVWQQRVEVEQQKFLKRKWSAESP